MANTTTTSYMKIYERFMSKITDYCLLDLDDDSVCKYCHDLMISAIAKIKTVKNDLYDYDDANSCFNSALLDIEIECIAVQMLYEWCEPQINNTTLTRQYMGTKDEKFYAPANLLDKLMILRDSELVRSQKLRRNYVYQNNDYLKQWQ